MDKHLHSYIHHKAVEQINGSKQVHKCWACDTSVMGLQQFQEHIVTHKHNQNLFKLQCKRRQNQILNNTELDVELYTTHTQKEQKSQQKCFVCCHSFQLQDLDRHMHSFVHREAIEKLKGSEQEHKCWACDWSVMGLQEYKKHIRTVYHKNRMSILTKTTSDDDKSTVDYSAEFDNELKALCAQRDQQIRKEKKKKKDRMLECIKAKTATAKQKSTQKKLIQNSQMKNMSKSVQVPIPAKAGDDFTSDELPVLCNLFSSYEQKQKITTFRPDQTALKRRQESVVGMDNSDFPLVKRPCPPSEISAHVSEEPTCAPEPVRTDDISILLRTIRKSLDYQDVNAGSEKNMKSHTKDGMGQTCKSNRKKELKERTKWSKKKHNKEKKSKESVSIHGSYNHKKRDEPCSHDAVLTLRFNQQDQMNTNKQKEQCVSREQINGQEASVASLSSVTSVAEKIERFHSQTLATCNVHDCQILDFGGNDSCKIDTYTDREKINGNNAETSQEELNSIQPVSCNLRKKQDISNTTHQAPETTCRQNKVNRLMTMSSREEELTDSLRNVGDQLFQAYATLQTAYTEVQHLLTVKQQVNSEMSSLRAKRIQLLQDMME